MLLAMAVFVTAIGAVKYRQVKSAIAQHAAFRPPPGAVTPVVARLERWPAKLTAIGTVVAVQGVTVSADLPGIVERIHFDSGKLVREGAVLVELDTRQERAQLAAAVAQEKLARLNFERFSGLRDKGIIAESEYDRTAAENTQGTARVGEIRATIERKTIRAPFTGVLGIRQVNLGQYLAGGAPIVSLQSLDPIYVNFSLPQQDLGKLAIGGPVRASVEGGAGAGRAELTGKITALDSTVNESTRNLAVQATFANPDKTLRPGMFVETEVVLGTAGPVVSLPASATTYAPYGDSVFVAAELKGPDGAAYRGVRQQFVKLGGARGDQIAVVSGIKPGEEVVTSGVFKLRNGAAVQVNNAVQPANNPAPKPEDS